jgi:hypothetical protein
MEKVGMVYGSDFVHPSIPRIESIAAASAAVFSVWAGE